MSSKEVGGHSNYNAKMDKNTWRSVTIPVSKLPFTLQKKVLQLVN